MDKVSQIVKLVYNRKLPHDWLIFAVLGDSDNGYEFPRYITLQRNLTSTYEHPTVLLAVLVCNPTLFIRLAKMYRPGNRSCVYFFVHPQQFSRKRLGAFLSLAHETHVLEEVVCLLARLCKRSHLALFYIAHECSRIFKRNHNLQRFLVGLDTKKQFPVGNLIAGIVRIRPSSVVPELSFATWTCIYSCRALSQSFNEQVPARVARSLCQRSIRQSLQFVGTERILMIKPNLLFNEQRDGKRSRRSQSCKPPNNGSAHRFPSQPKKPSKRFEKSPIVVFQYDQREWWIESEHMRCNDPTIFCRVDTSRPCEKATRVYPMGILDVRCDDKLVSDVTDQIGTRFTATPRSLIERLLENSYLCTSDLRYIREDVMAFGAEQWKRFLCFLHVDPTYRYDPFGLALLETILTQNRDVETRIFRYTRWDTGCENVSVSRAHMRVFPRACAVLMMTDKQNRLKNWIDAYTLGEQVCSEEMIGVLNRHRLFLRPDENISTLGLGEFDFPVEIKRLLWYSTNMQFDKDLCRVPWCFASEEALPYRSRSDIPTTVDFGSQETQSAEFSYRRCSRSFAIQQLINGPVSAKGWTLRFEDEEGQGSSVWLEVVRCLWQDAMKSGQVCDSPTGLAISPGEQGSDLGLMYALGLVSALCVARGLFLPFLVSDDVLRYLQLARLGSSHKKGEEWEVGGILCTNVFGAFKKNKESLMEDEDCDLDIEACSLPNRDCLVEFADAWVTYCSLPLAFSRGELVFLVCGPQCARIPTSLEIVQEFDQSEWSKPEQGVITMYLTNLQPEDILILLEFVTGKKRLPFLALGEPPLRVTPVERTDLQLACGQNCTNTLLLPRLAARNIESMRTALGPALYFQTSFGFV